MGHTINRQLAIDALADMHCKSDEDGYVWIIRSDAWARIDALPSAEPEIIRCKDCKHYKFADNRAFGFPVKRCEWTGFEDVDDDDFCSRGERKDDRCNCCLTLF